MLCFADEPTNWGNSRRGKVSKMHKGHIYLHTQTYTNIHIYGCTYSFSQTHTHT